MSAFPIALPGTAAPDLVWVTRQRAFASDPAAASHLLVERASTVSLVIGRRREKTSKTGKRMVWLQNDTVWRFSTRSGHLVVYNDVLTPGKRHLRADRTATFPSYGIAHHEPELAKALLIAIRDLSVRTIGYTPAIPDGLLDVPDAAAWMRRNLLPGMVWDIAYPLLRGRSGDPRFQPTIGIAPALRSETARGAAVALFGKRRARRDVIRAVATATPVALSIARQLRTVIPVDWLAEVLGALSGGEGGALDDHALRQIAERRARVLREMLAPIPLARRRRLLLSLAADPYIVSDTARVWEQAEDRAAADVTTWQTWHDSLTAVLWRQTHEDHAIDQHPFYAATDGLEVPVAGKTLVIRSPKATSEVYAWGQGLSHCIGSYADDARRGDTNLLAVYDGDQLYATAEIVPGTGETRQLYGRFNQALPDDEYAALVAAFARAHAESRAALSEAA